MLITDRRQWSCNGELEFWQGGSGEEPNKNELENGGKSINIIQGMYNVT